MEVMKTMVESANLSIWLTDGTCNEFELSPMQTLLITKILGIKQVEENCISCYSDETLKNFLEYKGNPLRLKEKE